MTRCLEGPELVAYASVCPPDLLRRVSVTKVCWLPNGASGLTLGHHILVRRDDDRTGSRKLLAHELVHVRQFAEWGAIGFVCRYALDYLRARRAHRRHHAAYLAIPFEIEARAEAGDWHKIVGDPAARSSTH